MHRPVFLVLIGLGLLLSACASPGPRWVRQGFQAACPGRPGFAAAAAANAESLDALAWSPFGAEERGWRIYAPRIAVEIGTGCAPESQTFAARLARWQARRSLAGDGRLTPETFEAMKDGWQGRRPFLALRARGACPEAPPETALAHAAEDEAVMNKPILLTPPALAALARLRADARRQLGLKPGDQTLLVFSAFRSPGYDNERCLRDQNCNGVVRAQCSAHRTATALDLVLGAAPGFELDSSASPNRLHQTGTAAYRWLTRRAGRYGFANYVFEPWHWEYVGAASPVR
jgi:hypothetical protein